MIERILRSLGICLFGLFIHPLFGPLIGRSWLQVEVFGIAPDPTAITTLGVLLTAHPRNWLLLIIPLLWCVISGATLWTMQSPEALMMLGIAALTAFLAARKVLSTRR